MRFGPSRKRAGGNTSFQGPRRHIVEGTLLAFGTAHAEDEAGLLTWKSGAVALSGS